jgi:hypothetical protein
MSRVASLLSFAFASAIVIGTYAASFDPPQWAFAAGEKGKPYPNRARGMHLSAIRSWPRFPER